MVLRVGDAWLVGVGKRVPHGFRCLSRSHIMARWKDSKACMDYFLYIELSKADKTRQDREWQGRSGKAGRAGSEMWGVLLVPSSSPTLSSIYDGLDVNVTYIVTCCHLNHNKTWFHVEFINYLSTEGTPSH